ncbi:MAG: hypothetical protein PHS14_15140 [Elusimicrobia bacterium]|nr:hypothetical protein [Elusimicrobiota bacterium]
MSDERLIPMRWGRTATRYVVQIKNRGRVNRFGGLRTARSYGNEAPESWQGIATRAARRSQRQRRLARRRRGY